MKVSDAFITLDRLRFYAYHGALPLERVVGNDYEVTLTLHYDSRDAMTADSLTVALNYDNVVKIVAAQMQQSSALLENVAARIAEAVQNRFTFVTAGTVTVSKLNPPVGIPMQAFSFTLSWQP